MDPRTSMSPPLAISPCAFSLVAFDCKYPSWNFPKNPKGALFPGYPFTKTPYPRPSNFIWSPDESLIIIDVESLVSDRLIGCGAAKALVSWMAEERSAFLAELQRADVPDFSSYFAYVELYFLARWQKRSVLHRKPWLVNPALFDRFRQYDSATNLE